MPSKAPQFGMTPQGVIQTEAPVQIGCGFCLFDGLAAPAENHVAYMYNGTSYCGKHFKTKVIEAVA